MKYVDGIRLSLPEDAEREALGARLSLDHSSTPENAALAVWLAKEGAAQAYVGPTVVCLARSPMWRLMLDELVAARLDDARLRMTFLLLSARLYQAGAEAERSSE